MFEPRPAIYTFLIDRLDLQNKTREQLKAKRGFTDFTIDKLKFKTACQENEAVVMEAVKKFGSGEVFVAGLIDKLGRPVWQLTNPDLTIIPYLDIDAKTTLFLQAHKYGSLAGMGVFPYSPLIFGDRTKDTIVLCESSFKAAAMWQMGWRSVGLAGVSTFAGENIDKLKECMIGAKKAIVLFDTEVQGDPAFASYKDNYRKRYAQHIWSFILAKRLQMICDGVDVRVASLPEEWTIDGKVDIDSAVAAGHTRAEFEVVLKDAVPPDPYRARINIEPKHKPWVNRRMEAAFKTNIVFEKDNSYWVRAETKQGPVFKQLSNFVIKVKNIIEKGDDIFREIVLTSKFEDTTHPFLLTSEEMSSFKSFKEKCLSRGDFLWKGTDQDFNMVIEDIFLDTSVTPVKILDMVGRDEPHEQWVFGNMIIKDDNTIIKPDKDGITFWDSEVGYRIAPLSKIGGALPKISEEPIDIETVMNAFRDAWGIVGIMAFTFVIASLFSNSIFNAYNAFPFAMIYGEKEAGKSTLAEMMMALVGFPANQAAMSLSETTQVAIGRKMSYCGSVPCCFDEFRNHEKKIEDKEAFLRSIYNRQTASKGTRESFGVREVKTAATMIMIGEQKPEDPALQSRLVPLYLANSSKTQKSWEAVRWLHMNHDKLSYVTLHAIKNYNETAKRIVKDIEDTRKGLADSGAAFNSFRVQLHFAILMATIGALFPPEQIIEIQEKFMASFVQVSNDQGNTSVLSRFFGDLVTMRIMGENVSSFLTLEKEDPNLGALYIGGLYNLWAKFKASRGGIRGLMDETTIKTYLKSQEYFVRNGAKRRVPAMEGKIRANCVIVKLAHEQTPQSIKDLFENVGYCDKGELYGESDSETDNGGTEDS